MRLPHDHRPLSQNAETDERNAFVGQLPDPRWGDAEDDAASPKRKSLVSILGNLLVEVSLPKLLFSWLILMMLPAVMLGVAPLAISAWFSKLADHIVALTEFGAVFVAITAISLGVFGWKPVFRMIEMNFWSLNALAVQPGYAIGREGFRHLTEKVMARNLTASSRGRLRAASSFGAGALLCVGGLLVLGFAWPHTRWVGAVADFMLPHQLLIPTFANAAVLISAYLASSALVWGVADALMAQPADRDVFEQGDCKGRVWRIAHLSDLHTVGERYGFRIESGRAGPRGNERLEKLFQRLTEAHGASPLDYVLVTGDLTDAGLATEWAEFLDILERYPVLAERMLVLPGNHDLNIVDPANPARLDLPFSTAKRLRQVRTIAAMSRIQGHRVSVCDRVGAQQTLDGALTRHLARIAEFSEEGGAVRAARLDGLLDEIFPMIVPPVHSHGLGIAILNSNADTHFSFTNALGVIPLAQARKLDAAISQYPDACWIVALHHHLMEYPVQVNKFAERIGTALVNGSWFIRKLMSVAPRCVVMHGHRHVDWVGSFGALNVISAPSPVMSENPTPHFYIHSLEVADGRLRLREPERIAVPATDDGIPASVNVQTDNRPSLSVLPLARTQ